MSNFKLYSVNWQDGMLLNEQHLMEQERYLEEVARWYAAPVGDTYGLVRRGHGAPPALEIKSSVSGGSLRVEVVRCMAITPDGHIIAIDSDQGEPLKAAAAVGGGDVPVFISVKPAERLAIGSPDPSEEVPRMPYRAGNYALHVGERPTVSEGSLLQIALLRVQGSEVSPAEGYFPPCETTFADERLDQKVNDLRNRLESLLSIANRGYATLTAGEKTDLQRQLQTFVYQFVLHLAASVDGFVTGHNGGSPLYVVTYFRKLFRIFGTLVRLHPGVKDYVHEKYFVKEAGSDVSRFVTDVENFLTSQYDHEDVGSQIAAAESLLDQVRGVLSYLAQMKGEDLGPQAVATDTLTYSGKTYKIAPYSVTKAEQAGELLYLAVNLAEPRPMKDTVILLAKSLVSPQEWSAMHVRLGLNDARGLGETDPVAVDAVSYGDKVALHPHDMLQSASVKKVTVIFRGVSDAAAFAKLGKMDLFVYAV